MTIFGENFFRVSNLNRDLNLNKPQKSGNIPDIQEPGKIDKDKHNKEKKEIPECAICPNKNTDYCDKCLRVQQIYV